MSSPAMSMQVTADLQLDIDGLVARIDGDGSLVTVAVDDAVALAACVRDAGATLPTSLAGRRRLLIRSVRAIDDAGLTVRLVDSQGPLVSAGRGAHSRLARVLVADAHVQLAPRRETAAMVAALLRPRGLQPARLIQRAKMLRKSRAS